jgi:hypothetical protein
MIPYRRSFGNSASGTARRNRLDLQGAELSKLPMPRPSSPRSQFSSALSGVSIHDHLGPGDAGIMRLFEYRRPGSGTALRQDGQGIAMATVRARQSAAPAIRQSAADR